MVGRGSPRIGEARLENVNAMDGAYRLDACQSEGYLKFRTEAPLKTHKIVM